MQAGSNNKDDYKWRINKVLDYIETHLPEQLTLDELAAAASFSKYHFTRVFQAMTSETPFRFILRIRLERAALLIVSNPADRISDIAVRCGFTELSVFSRNFSSYFGMSASEYRSRKSNLSKEVRNDCQAGDRPQLYFCPETKTIKWSTTMKQIKDVEVKDVPEMTLAYVRHTGPYQGNEKLFEKLWTKLFTWAGPRNLVGGPDFKSLVIYHDDPNITGDEKLRMSVCITVPAATKVNGEIGLMKLEAARCMIARFEVMATEFQQAWDWVYSQWLPSSGYQPDDKPCYEAYSEEPKDGKFIVDICVPVKPL